MKLEAGNLLSLPEDEAYHIQKVLRGKPGSVVEVVDKSRNLFAAELRGRGEAVILEKLHGSGRGHSEVILYQAVPKGKHMDLVVEKATELGVAAIVPLVTERSVVRPGGEVKVERWRRLARAAARQSLQLRVPDVREPTGFGQAVREAGEEGVLLHNAARLSQLEEVISGSPVRLFVGPEGGWNEEEIGLAEENGFSVAQLGASRLRSETAGIVATARTTAVLERTAGKP